MTIRQAFLASRLWHLALLALGSQLIACSDSSGPPDAEFDVARVEITPAAFQLAEGHQQQLAVEVYDAQDQIIPNCPVVWSSSDVTIAQLVRADGRVEALREGTATIFAECAGVRGTATVTVTRAVVFGVGLLPGAVELAPGHFMTLEARPIDDIGRVLTGRTIEWSSSDPLVASVSAQGVVTAHTFGAVFITATVEGVSGRASIYTLAGPTNVTEIDLGTLGGPESFATGVNSQGVVVGFSRTSSGQTRAFRWTASGGMQDLGTLGGNSSLALGINDNGVIVGHSRTAGNVDRAFRWTVAGGMQELPIGEPLKPSSATAINAGGDIVGAFRSTSVDRAFLLTSTGTFHDIGTIPGRFAATAKAVNAQRTVVGASYNLDIFYYYYPEDLVAFRWSNGSFQQMDVVASDALGINDQGEIVGTTSDAQPYRWIPGQQPLALSNFGLSTSFGTAKAINHHGHVAGDLFAATYHAVIWLNGTQRLLLSQSSSSAAAISNGSWVVGSRWGPGDAPSRATLWKIAGVSQP